MSAVPEEKAGASVSALLGDSSRKSLCRGFGWGSWLVSGAKRAEDLVGSRGAGWRDGAGVSEVTGWGEEELMRWQRKKMGCNLSGN